MLPLSVEFAIGSATGLLDCALFHWIDTLKVRRQDGRPLLMNVKTGLPLQRVAYRSRQAFAAACMASLYAGFSTNLSLKVPYMASMFAFSAGNMQLLAWLDRKEESSSNHGGGSSNYNGLRELAAAMLVGVEVSLLLSPLEMVRIQGQNNGKGGLFSAMRAVAATASGQGFIGRWRVWTRGMTATMHRESKYCAGQFFLCAKISEWVSDFICQPAVIPGGQTEVEGAGHAQAAKARPTALQTLGAQVVGAVLGGVACTVVSHPDDVIKTRMQTHLKGSSQFDAYASFGRSGLHMIRTEGLAALFKGAAIRCLLRVPLGLSVIIVSGNWMRTRAEQQLHRAPCRAES